MAKTKIAWTDENWNPIRGCSKASAGCDNCYAAAFASRMPWGEGYAEDGDWTGKVDVLEDKINLPYSWRTPRRVFVNSTSDLFHPKVPVATVRRILKVIGDNPKHLFQILTKRAKRLASLKLDFPDNAWVGVSVEDQRVVDRIDHLKQVDAVIRWVSFEPLIGPIDYDLNTIDWAVVGGESGSGWRPIEADWVRSIRDECRRVGAAFFFKQWAAMRPTQLGRKLDGRVYDEYPA